MKSAAKPKKSPLPPEPKPHVHETARTAEFCACGASRIDHGAWEIGKDPIAVTLGAKAVAMSTHEERVARGRKGGASRWAGISPQERSEFMQFVSGRPRPGRRNEDRCSCGRYSRVVADRKGHLCGRKLIEALEALEQGGPGNG